MARINHTGANSTLTADKDWLVTSIGCETAGTVTFRINGTDYDISVAANTIVNVNVSLAIGDSVTTDANTFASIDTTPNNWRSI